MKHIALCLGLTFAAAVPALAMPPQAQQQNQPAAQQQSGPIVEDAAAPIDEHAIEAASSPEDRARLMLRCAGPPPRMPDHIASAKPQPMSEKPVG